MKQSNDASNVECDFGDSNAIPVDYWNKQSIGFSHHSNNENSQCAGVSDQNESAYSDEMTNLTSANDGFKTAIATGPSYLAKKLNLHFDETNNETEILSPISKLSLNVAWEKLFSTCDLMGKSNLMM